MASYSFNVDTHPMADQMNRVSEHVNGVSTAVVTMQTAVIAAEVKATNILCDKVNTGFYQLIISQIAQKCVIAESEAQALVLELAEQSKDITELKIRMGNDFEMITARYTDHFNKLNKALQNRIYELDKPTINFVSKDILTSENRITRLIAQVPVNQSESLSVSQAIAAGQIKNNAVVLIDNMKQYLKFFNYQRQLSEQVIQNEALEQTEMTFIPVIVAQHEEGANTARKAYIADPHDLQLKCRIEAPITKDVAKSAYELQWREVDNVTYQQVTGEFNRQVATANIPKRVEVMMNKLYQQQKWQKAGEV